MKNFFNLHTQVIIYSSQKQFQKNPSAEDLYSPSFWSKRLSQDLVVKEHVRVTSEESIRVRNEIPYQTFKYGASIHEKLDVFTTNEDNNQPIFVYFSGGYWQELSGDISAYVVSPFQQSNMSCVIVDYSRAPGGT